MRRVIIWLVVLLLAVVAVAQPAQAEPAGQDSVTVDGKDVAFDVEPVVVNWVLMLPVRAVAESLGGEVTWQAETRTAVIRTGSTQVKLTVGSDTAVVNGQKVKLATPVTIRENRMLVPASFLLTLFGQKVTIHNPALKDPVAISLLEKGRANGLRNIDLQMVQQTT
ncbi:MAG: copper amine oxidase N-terminal domain-containing protein, partial [Mycobacterium leprae]